MGTTYPRRIPTQMGAITNIRTNETNTTNMPNLRRDHQAHPTDEYTITEEQILDYWLTLTRTLAPSTQTNNDDTGQQFTTPQSPQPIQTGDAHTTNTSEHQDFIHAIYTRNQHITTQAARDTAAGPSTSTTNPPLATPAVPRLDHLGRTSQYAMQCEALWVEKESKESWKRSNEHDSPLQGCAYNQHQHKSTHGSLPQNTTLRPQ